MDFYSKKLKIVIISVLGIIFLALSLNRPSFKGNNLIVWNVGQGQMVTYQTPKMCAHFDSGGDIKKFPKKKLLQVCYDKENIIYYTHWDQDHINYSYRIRKIFPTLCRVKTSLEDPKNVFKRKRIKRIPLCTKNPPTEIKELRGFYHKAKTSNERSRIFIISDKILIPGDSNKKMEKYWSPLLPSSIQVLVAGHHGSKTSSSPLLISKLKNLKLVIVSARKKKYGHPHKEVVKRFNQKGILLKTTELFNHIRVPLLQKKIRSYSL